LKSGNTALEDIDYWLFLKLIRGDTGDNVPSAFPRVREVKLKEAFSDSYKMLNLLNESWTDINGNENIVKDKLEENRILMDLACQPADGLDFVAGVINKGFNLSISEAMDSNPSLPKPLKNLI
jgi:hypothetical protein